MKELKKIELHLHLEGAAPAGFIRGLASEQKVSLDGVFDEAGHYAYDDFSGFLRTYEAATSVLRSPEHYARLTREVLEQSASHGVIYTEAFISPDFCGGGDVSAWRDYLAAIQEAALEAQTACGIEMRGIVTCIRHFGPDRAKAVARCAAETAGSFITGFGMGGDESIGTARDYAWAFDCAREAQLALTSHAGEWGAPDTIRAAWQDLGLARIGHGVRAVEDPRLCEDLAEAGVVLEVCPGSNIALGIYRNFDAHPIEKLRERGVKVTVSTDDPPFFHTTMTAEYEALDRSFGWGVDGLMAQARVAAEAAFCDPETKSRLLNALENTP